MLRAEGNTRGEAIFICHLMGPSSRATRCAFGPAPPPLRMGGQQMEPASCLPACPRGPMYVPRTGEAFEWESKRIFLALLCWVFGPNMPGIFPCDGKWTAISILNVCLFMMPHQEHMATDEAVFLSFLPLPPFLSALLTESPSLLPLTPSSLSLCLLGLTPVFKPSCSQFSNVQSYW